MTQNEFFNILMDGLKDIPEKKLQDIIFYYDHNFTLGLTAGKTEEEIINELGDPNLIVNKYKNEDMEIPTTKSHTKDVVDTFINIDDNSSNDDTISFAKNENIILDAKTDNLVNAYPKADSEDNNNNNNNNNNRSHNYSNNANFNSNQNSNNFTGNFTSQNHNTKSSQSPVNTILKICIAFLALIIFFPVITGIIGFVIGLFGIAIGIFAASIGVLIGGTFTSLMGLPNLPAFVANFPYPVIVLFSLGSISLSILLTLLFYYFCKLCVRLIIKFYNSLKIKGGTF